MTKEALLIFQLSADNSKFMHDALPFGNVLCYFFLILINNRTTALVKPATATARTIIRTWFVLSELPGLFVPGSEAAIPSWLTDEVTSAATVVPSEDVSPPVWLAADVSVEPAVSDGTGVVLGVGASGVTAGVGDGGAVGVGDGVAGAVVGVGDGAAGAVVGVGDGVAGAVVGVGDGVAGAAVGVGVGVAGAAVGVGDGSGRGITVMGLMEGMG